MKKEKWFLQKDNWVATAFVLVVCISLVYSFNPTFSISALLSDSEGDTLVRAPQFESPAQEIFEEDCSSYDLSVEVSDDNPAQVPVLSFAYDESEAIAQVYFSSGLDERSPREMDLFHSVEADSSGVFSQALPFLHIGDSLAQVRLYDPATEQVFCSQEIRFLRSAPLFSPSFQLDVDVDSGSNPLQYLIHVYNENNGADYDSTIFWGHPHAGSIHILGKMTFPSEFLKTVQLHDGRLVVSNEGEQELWVLGWDGSILETIPTPGIHHDFDVTDNGYCWTAYTGCEQAVDSHGNIIVDDAGIPYDIIKDEIQCYDPDNPGAGVWTELDITGAIGIEWDTLSDDEVLAAFDLTRTRISEDKIDTTPGTCTNAVDPIYANSYNYGEGMHLITTAGNFESFLVFDTTSDDVTLFMDDPLFGVSPDVDFSFDGIDKLHASTIKAINDENMEVYLFNRRVDLTEDASGDIVVSADPSQTIVYSWDITTNSVTELQTLEQNGGQVTFIFGGVEYDDTFGETLALMTSTTSGQADIIGEDGRIVLSYSPVVPFDVYDGTSFPEQLLQEGKLVAIGDLFHVPGIVY